MENFLIDEEYLTEALKEAYGAFENGECAIGAILVKDKKIISRSGNRELELNDPTAHAEILVIRKAAKFLKATRLPDCTLYTTLIPCPMCENAILQAHIPRVVYGCKGFKWIRKERFNGKNVSMRGPLMEEECRAPFVQWAKDTNRHEILDPSDL